MSNFHGANIGDVWVHRGIKEREEEERREGNGRRMGNWRADRGRGFFKDGKNCVPREKSKQLVEIIKRLVTVIELKLS